MLLPKTPLQERIQQLATYCATPSDRAVAVAIARGPNSHAQALSTRGLVWVEAGPGQHSKRRNYD